MRTYKRKPGSLGYATHYSADSLESWPCTDESS